MNTLIKSQPERLAAATAYANHYDGPAIRRIAQNAWVAGYVQAERDSKRVIRELNERLAERTAAYEAKDRTQVARIRQLVSDHEELERDHDTLLRRQGGEV